MSKLDWFGAILFLAIEFLFVWIFGTLCNQSFEQCCYIYLWVFVATIIIEALKSK